MTPGHGQSIYMWMYRQGLRQRPLEHVVMDCMLAGNDIRPKDLRNYWNGWYRHDLYFGSNYEDRMQSLDVRCSPGSNGPMAYMDYPPHPYIGRPEVANCYVPCNADNRPMIKWGGGCMSMQDAKSWPGSVYIGENLRGTRRIVVDVDGDHGDQLDLDALRFFARYMERTMCHVKPKIVFDWFEETEGCYSGDLHTAELPVSYHLTFTVDKVIPTMHFPKAHVDIVGNRNNSLRYFKNKKWNGLPPIEMTEEIWDEISEYIEDKERRS